MVENLFPIREKEIFEILNSLKNQKFVIIGGYAVNAYVLPRFSVDCDIVVHKEDISEISSILEKIGFTESQETSDLSYGGKFKRFEKQIRKDFGVSIDILIGEVMDRQTGSVFSADWIFENSQVRILRGKTITEKLETRIVNPEALFATKLVSCRKTTIFASWFRTTTGCSAVRLARVVRDDEAGGSNPLTPTTADSFSLSC